MFSTMETASLCEEEISEARLRGRGVAKCVYAARGSQATLPTPTNYNYSMSQWNGYSKKLTREREGKGRRRERKDQHRRDYARWYTVVECAVSLSVVRPARRRVTC